MIYNDGGIYEGAWKDGKRHGKGKMTDKDGIFYEGEWTYGESQGQGKMTYEDGNYIINPQAVININELEMIETIETIEKLNKLIQSLYGQEYNKNVNMSDIEKLLYALDKREIIKINTQIQKLNEALDKKAELQIIIEKAHKQDYEKKLIWLKEAVENFKNSKQ